MFNREIRTRLDFMIPKQSIEDDSVKPNQFTVRKLNVNDRVSARDYTGGEKYQFGIIIEVLGKLHCMVKLDDGRIWKRHIDQIHRIGSNIKIPNNDPIPFHYDLSQNRQIVPSSEISDGKQTTDVTPPQAEATHMDISTEEEIDIDLPAQNIPPISSTTDEMPKRVRKPRNILTYDKQFKQISK